jgi:hypothetical protein
MDASEESLNFWAEHSQNQLRRSLLAMASSIQLDYGDI